MSVASKLTAIADAIRAKTGGTGSLTLDQMATEIAGISAGGSGGIDTSDADATASDIAEGKTAYVNGVKVTGEVETPTVNDTIVASSLGWVSQSTVSGVTIAPQVVIKVTPKQNWFLKNEEEFWVEGTAGMFGDAAAEDVVAGKTFTSTAGVKVTGTHECSGTDTSDATATAADITSGKTAYVNGEKITGTHTCSSGVGLVMKSGTTTSGTIETGLSSVKCIVIYKDAVRATGLVQAVWLADDGTGHYTYCSSYSTYMKSYAVGTDTASTVSGGTFTWGGSGTSGLSSGVTYNWIAFGEA